MAKHSVPTAPSMEETMRWDAEHQVDEVMRKTPQFKKAVDAMVSHIKEGRQEAMKHMQSKAKTPAPTISKGRAMQRAKTAPPTVVSRKK